MDFHARLFAAQDYLMRYMDNLHMGVIPHIDLHLNQRNWEEFQRWLKTPEGKFASDGVYTVHCIHSVFHIMRRRDDEIPRLRPKARPGRPRMVRSGQRERGGSNTALDL